MRDFAVKIKPDKTLRPSHQTFLTTVTSPLRSDGLDMTFAWDFNSNGTVDTYEPHPHYVYTVAGVHVATLTITTAASTKSCTIPVDVASEGNTAPDVRVVFPPQGGVFTWGDQVDFKVSR